MTATATTSAPATSSFSTELAAFLAAIRQHESGGSYSAYNAAGGAFGAYQFIQSTWSSAATAAGYPQYAGKPASAAPPAVQDAVAASMAQGYYKAFGGNWTNAAEAWYYPAWAGDAAHQNSVPDPAAGNTLTIGQYGAQIHGTMQQLLGDPAALQKAPVVTASVNTAVGGAASSIVDSIPGVGFLDAIFGGGISNLVASAVSGAFDVLLYIAFTVGAIAMILIGFSRLFPGVTRTVTSSLQTAGTAAALA